MKTCVICVSKDSFDIKDWYNHYFLLGFDHIFLFDNNDFDKRYDINDERITIIPISSEFSAHGASKTWEMRQSYLIKIGLLLAYDQDYDYCFICDDDEYIDLKGNYNNVQELINNYSSYDAISLYWENTSNNGYLYISDEPQNKTFREIYSKYYKHDGILTDGEYPEKSFYKIPKDFNNLKMVLDKSNYDGYIIHKVTDVNRIFINDMSESSIKHYTNPCFERYLLKKGKYNGMDLPEYRHSYLLHYFGDRDYSDKELDAFIDLCKKYNITMKSGDIEILKKYNRITE